LATGFIRSKNNDTSFAGIVKRGTDKNHPIVERKNDGKLKRKEKSQTQSRRPKRRPKKAKMEAEEKARGFN